ncbi:MAG: hypothetical protein KTR31_14525 [Myxococcales bacterium]|nr:hypothetical protein [Myxococcales bacterium]
MYAKRHFQLIRQAIPWTYPVLLAMAVWAGALTLLRTELGWTWIQLPALPISILGTAVSFYLGFKGNSAYDRLWEARKIWGGIVNTSRTWGVYVTTLITDLHREEQDPESLAQVHRELTYRHVAWLGALRTQLRRPKAWEHRLEWNDDFRKLYDTFDNSPEALRLRIEEFVDEDELDALMKYKNQATQLVRKQGERLTELYAQRRIDDFRHVKLIALLEELYTLQGKCERIKNFPLPRQYATVNRWFVNLFITLMPLALLGAFGKADLPPGYIWLTVPVSMVMGWVFHLWDSVVDYSENPFEGLVNDIPMTALSRTIEIDLREMLGETELPPPVTASETGGLM